MYALEYVVKKYFSDNKKYFDYKKKRFYKKERDFNIELNLNNTVEKLKTRIAKNLLFVSYGRNHDRFMDYATRFLAESNYFGKDAEFKMYQFFSSDEQNNELIKKREEYEKMHKDSVEQKEAKKKYDNLKFHQGKLVHYSTFESHLKNYESWDTPFVIENNAVHVRITFFNGIKKIVTIQRNLMIYFLEDSLHNISRIQIENSGIYLLDSYYTHHKVEFDRSKLFLQQNTSISNDDKAAFKKILPRRLLHHYSPAIQNNLPEFTTFQLLLEKAKKSEKRYENLKVKAEKEKNLDDFIKRNKGRQFKLQFIRKACHLMYFKDSYLQQIKAEGHHKRFHISKDEFNDFSKWMYAFDDTPKYKEYLQELFSQKGFFNNSEYKILFEKSSSLDEMYKRTKINYEEWLKIFNPENKATNKYTLSNYEKFFKNELFYINVPHFIKFLEGKKTLSRNENGNIIYKSLINKDFLIEDYYYKDKLEKVEYQSCGKLYNKLKTVRLEDSLLYELAIYYLEIDNTIIKKVKTNIVELLTKPIVFNINDVQNNHIYDLIIPFNKIDSYVELIKHKEEQEQDKRYKGSSFICNLHSYIENVLVNEIDENKEINLIYKNYIRDKVLSFDDINKINNHLIRNSIMFTKVDLALEEYFILKDFISIKKNNRITFNEIVNLANSYIDEKIRNKAFHFGIPNESYKVILTGIEMKFIQKEIKPIKYSEYNNLSKPLKSVCNALLDTIHNDYFDRKEDDKNRREKANKKYFQNVILGK
ncbi:MAG: hypothetical protein HGB12_11215 [Bacteroidetes bacterium]|nr:hypothetical protein [Bacteroidota bacterium]